MIHYPVSGKFLPGYNPCPKCVFTSDVGKMRREFD